LKDFLSDGIVGGMDIETQLLEISDLIRIHPFGFILSDSSINNFFHN
jgi:hypothetical protein